MLQREKKKDPPPKTTPDSCYVTIFSDSSAVFSPNRSARVASATKIQSKHKWFRICKFKNVPVKSHELKTSTINTSKQTQILKNEKLLAK